MHGMRRLRPELRLWCNYGQVWCGLRFSDYQWYDHWRGTHLRV
jgi:hypothetical protein